MHSLGDIDFRDCAARPSAYSAPARPRRLRGRSARSTAPRASRCWCGAPTCRASTRTWASAARGSGTASTASPTRRNGRSSNYIDEQAVPPPRNSMLRCTPAQEFLAFWRAVRRARSTIRDGRVLLDTTRGRLAFDRLILATGLAVDWSQRPEFAALKPHVAALARPFRAARRSRLRAGGAPLSRTRISNFCRATGGAPWVNRIHCFNYAATMSHGPISGDIPAISIGAERAAPAS